MRALWLTGADASARASLMERLSSPLVWAASPGDTAGTVVLVRSREDWALLNRLHQVVAIITFDSRYADEEHSGSLPIFYIEEEQRILDYLTGYDQLFSPVTATQEVYEYDGCLW